MDFFYCAYIFFNLTLNFYFMKTTFLTLVLLVFGFSSFAFMPSFPAESTSTSEKNVAVASEKPKSESENKTETKEAKTVTAKELTQKMEANYETNKKQMSFKERLASKLLIKKLQKAVKKDAKSPNKSKGSTELFHILGILLIVLGVISLIFLNLYGGVVTIVIGIFIYLLPELI